MSKVFQHRKLCHCIMRWEKSQNSRPIRQCFNCQFFGHSSKFCGRPPKCVKCDQQHATKDRRKPAGSPPKCVNCGDEHPANYTRCPQYLRQLHHTPQINNQQKCKPYTIKPNSPQHYILIMSNKIQQYAGFYLYEITQHISGVHRTHHQEYIN